MRSGINTTVKQKQCKDSVYDTFIQLLNMHIHKNLMKENRISFIFQVNFSFHISV